ncbi:hypothetical protein B0H17DRAFT_943096, partial [Mycena rosella]
LRKLANKIINSSTKLLPRWRAVVEANRLKPKNLPRDVKTRWNSNFDMINTGLAYRCAIHEFTLDSSNGLSDFHLSSTKWAILGNLRDILMDATLYFSRDSATLATVIPSMDKLDTMLATAIITKPDGEKSVFTAAVKVALVYAKTTLNRYYAKAADSLIYRNAVCKLSIFCSSDATESDDVSTSP